MNRPQKSQALNAERAGEGKEGERNAVLDARRLIELDREHMLPSFVPLDEHAANGPTIMVRGKGVLVWDIDGNEYLDSAAGIWNVNLGFGRVEIADAVREQIKQLCFHINLLNLSTPPAIEFAARLAALAPGELKRVLLTSGGSESNETAVRLARLYFALRGSPGKTAAIARYFGYHGSTLAAAALTGIERFHRYYGPPALKVRHIAPPYRYRCELCREADACTLACADELEKAIVEEGPHNIGLFIAEPVIGSGGVIPAPKEYWTRIRQICDRHDVLFVADEVITAGGRTGKMFACEHWDVLPDIITCAKGISSGYQPLGAVLVHEKIYRTILNGPTGLAIWHGFTNTGHPACCAAGLKTLEIIESEQLVERAERMGQRMFNGLRALAASPIVGDIRGQGLMAGVELVQDKQTRRAFAQTAGVGKFMRQAAREVGLLLRLSGDVICLSPPLVISECEMDVLLERLSAALAKTEAWVAQQNFSAAS
jgi:adenosylmethionine-8-amino-7-oxononanoate aminotransferase